MDIQKLLSTNNLIIFAGSGLSKSLQLPDWNEMVIDIIANLHNEDLNSFIPLLQKNLMSPIDVLDNIKRYKTDIYKYVEEKFKLPSDANLEIHKKILKLSDNKIITTNYDNAFELASNNTIIASKPTSKYRINEIGKADSAFIFKLHGSFEEPDNCIIFREDYEKLYDLKNNEAAPEKLKNLFSNSTLLFIGFGFNDPDIDLIFDKMDRIFGGLNKHYIITTDSFKFEKYKFLESIPIDSFDNLEQQINEMLEQKNKMQLISLEQENTKTINNCKSRKRIAILYPDILNKPFHLDIKNTITPFEEIEADLLIGSLNINSLQMIDDYDLLIIISNIYKGKIYIEEDNLKSNLLHLKDLLDNLPNQDIPLLILTNEKLDITEIDQPIINIFDYKNQTIKRFLHKILKDNCFSFAENSIISNNNWHISLEKGKGMKSNLYGNDRNLDIGKKCLSNVIGRVEEQSSLIARFLMINNSNKILNIKASGGLGKTTISKKIAYELYNRGYYKDGVNFKSCENVKNYDDFESIVLEGFNLAEILNFREYLIENFSSEKIDLLVILDNFETVVNNLTKEDYSKVLNLLEFVSDYSNVVLTSREVIGNQAFEEVFTLTPMTTDDALELFKLNYSGKKKYTDEEIKILRAEILEDLLANNPLAIKLVTTSRPEMNISHLRDQIRNHFFESINEEYSDVFKNNADLNIERSRSIFQSINYSYSFLNQKEKLAFELLSLFPDGINLNDFKKCFQKNKSTNNITDTDIKKLENKSLLENYNGRLQLQPIIRRFADYQFYKHKDNIKKYCTDAYIYNSRLLSILNFIQDKETVSSALKSFSTIKNNLLLVLEYMPNIIVEEKGTISDKKYLLNYIYDLEDFLTNEKNISYFERCVRSLDNFFSEIEHSNNLITVLILKANYYQSEFDNSYDQMTNLLSVNEMRDRKYESEGDMEKRWKSIISHIHSMEGFTMDYLKLLISNEDYAKYLSSDLYYLGIAEDLAIKSYGNFYKFEYLLRIGSLDVTVIKNYIASLYMEEHLEIMQCTYTLSKIEIIHLNKIQKLVVTNPYTRGLKNLMFAFNTENRKEKIAFFKKAIDNLQHIKYYYLESLYYYTKYLKLIESEHYEENLKLGLEDARKYKYKYLDHLFSNLLQDTDEKYTFNYEYYETEGLEEFITNHTDKMKSLMVK